MLSRLKDFMLFIESFDSDSIVILQAGYNVPIFQKESKRDEYNLLTYVKAPKICQKDLDKGLNNINSVRSLLSCATNKKFNFLVFSCKIFRFNEALQLGTILLRRYKKITKMLLIHNLSVLLNEIKEKLGLMINYFMLFVV